MAFGKCPYPSQLASTRGKFTGRRRPVRAVCPGCCVLPPLTVMNDDGARFSLSCTMYSTRYAGLCPLPGERDGSTRSMAVAFPEEYI